MNIQAVIDDLKCLVKTATCFVEHSPRQTQYMDAVQDAPNTGVFRVVVMGTGKTKQAGLNRYADVAIVIAEPLSGGDANKTNEEAAVKAEELTTVIADYAGIEAMTQEEIETTINRDAARSVITISARIIYKLT